jgi:hypothetical protein
MSASAKSKFNVQLGKFWRQGNEIDIHQAQGANKEKAPASVRT